MNLGKITIILWAILGLSSYYTPVIKIFYNELEVKNVNLYKDWKPKNKKTYEYVVKKYKTEGVIEIEHNSFNAMKKEELSLELDEVDFISTIALNKLMKSNPKFGYSIIEKYDKYLPDLIKKDKLQKNINQFVLILTAIFSLILGSKFSHIFRS